MFKKSTPYFLNTLEKNHSYIKKFKAEIQNFGAIIPRGGYVDSKKQSSLTSILKEELDPKFEFYACFADVQNYIRYDRTLLLLLYTLTITLV